MEKDVPYIVYESEQARHERTVKRLIIALLLSIAEAGQLTADSFREMHQAW